MPNKKGLIMELSQDQISILAVGLVFGVLIGIPLSLSSFKKEAVYGGFIAKIFNTLGAILFAGVLPGVLYGIFFGHGLAAFPIAVAMMIGSLLSFLLFAIVEYPAKQRLEPKSDEEGWTEADARSSGL